MFKKKAILKIPGRPSLKLFSYFLEDEDFPEVEEADFLDEEDPFFEVDFVGIVLIFKS